MAAAPPGREEGVFSATYNCAPEYRNFSHRKARVRARALSKPGRSGGSPAALDASACPLEALVGPNQAATQPLVCVWGVVGSLQDVDDGERP